MSYNHQQNYNGQYQVTHAQILQPGPAPQIIYYKPKPVMETFNACNYICPMLCWPLIPCLLVRMCVKYEEKKTWNIERMGEDFDECLYFKKSYLCCVVLVCDCCCNACCSCIWVGSKERQVKKDKIAHISIATLEGSMGIAVNKENMTPQQYEAYLRSKKKQFEIDAANAAEKPPVSRSVRDIKLMIVQSMIENGEAKDALELLKDLDKLKESEIENFRDENPTSLRTKGLRVVAGVLQIAAVVVPVAGAGALLVGFAADCSEKMDKGSAKSSKSNDSNRQSGSPMQNNHSQQQQQTQEVIMAVVIPTPSPSPHPEIVMDASYLEYLEYQKFMKAKSALVPTGDAVQNPMVPQSPPAVQMIGMLSNQ